MVYLTAIASEVVAYIDERRRAIGTAVGSSRQRYNNEDRVHEMPGPHSAYLLNRIIHESHDAGDGSKILDYGMTLS